MADLKTLKINGVNIYDLLFPVGCIFQTMDETFNPATAYGGEWERIKGKVLVGVDEDDVDFSTSGITGGEKTHTLETAEMPSHIHNHPNSGHTFFWGPNKGDVYVKANAMAGTSSDNNLYTYQGVNSKTSSSGSGSPHNNLQPFKTCYIWERMS